MRELLEEARLISENTLQKRKVLIEFHKRLVLPVGCLIISLIGLPLGLQARPGKKAIGIQAGLAIFVLYYIFFTLGKTMAEEDILPIPLAMWAPNALFTFLTVFWIVRVSNEQPLIPEPVTTVLKRLAAMLVAPIVGLCNRALNRFKTVPAPSDGPENGGRARSTGPGIKGDPRSRVFHLPACEEYNCKNCTLEFRGVDVALESGFEPCGFCKDLVDDYKQSIRTISTQSGKQN